MALELSSVDEGVAVRLQIHAALIEKWNKSAGLVGPKALADLRPHYLDSIEIARFAGGLTEDGVVDLGSGGGFPGLVFSAMFPDRFVRLVERDSRKRSFLKNAAMEMGLARVHVEAEFEKGYDGVLMARAVAPPEKLLKFLKSRILPGGRVVMALGPEEELPELKPHWELSQTHPYSLPDGAGNRRLELVSRGTPAPKK